MMLRLKYNYNCRIGGVEKNKVVLKNTIIIVANNQDIMFRGGASLATQEEKYNYNCENDEQDGKVKKK